MSVSRDTTPATDMTKDRPAQGPSKAAPRTNRANVAPNNDARPTSKLTETDIIKNSQFNIKSNEAARKWLSDHDYIIPGEDLSIAALTMALLYQPMNAP